MVVPITRHWLDSSRIADVETGLKALSGAVQAGDIRSIAATAFDYGLGDLYVANGVSQGSRWRL
jgi:hypothetical protein